MSQGQETVEKVFSRDKFSIPQYQRDYAWKKKNFEDLWEDLEEALDVSDIQGHFLGTIVVAPNDEDISKYDIIDGQQRTTTIFMFLYALICRSEYKENLKIKYLLDRKNQIKLEVAPQNQSFFQELLCEADKGVVSDEVKKKADTQGKQNLCEVFEVILDKVSGLKQEDVEKYTKTLLSMILMWLEEPNSGRAIRTFQSVNDRGVPLNLLDKLKSLLIYYSNTYCDGDKGLDKLINNTFGDIFKTFLKIENHPHISSIGNQQFGESDIFRYHAGSIKFDDIEFLGHYRKSNEVTYDYLKSELKALAKMEKRVELERFIRHYTEDLGNFYKSFLELLDEINNNTNIFKLLLIEKINPFFYNSLVRLKMNGELDDEILKLFAKADVLFFKSGGSRDATAYNLIFPCLEGREVLFREMMFQCKKCEVKNAIRQLVDYAYDMSSFHYVFFEKNCSNMDIESLKGLIEKKILTQEKEHIAPLNLWETDNEAEIKKIGFEDIDDFEAYMNSYGNLLSIEKTLNIKAKDKELYGKADVYKDSKIPYVRRFDVKNFNKNVLKERNEDFAKWLENEFFKDFL